MSIPNVSAGSGSVGGIVQGSSKIGKTDKPPANLCKLLYEVNDIFIEVLTLKLAKKLAPTLIGTKSPEFMEDLDKEFYATLSKVRTIDKQDTNTIGQDNLRIWNDSRYR